MNLKNPENNNYKAIADEILSANRILFITGAGISADSGMPTYRGIGGLYNNGNTEEGIPIETAISGNMFKERPDITWKYLWLIGKSCAESLTMPIKLSVKYNV